MMLHPKFSPKMYRVFVFAWSETNEHGATFIEPEHLLLGLIRADMDLINRFFSGGTGLSSLFKMLEAHTPVGEKQTLHERLANLHPLEDHTPIREKPPELSNVNLLSARSQTVLRFAVEEAGSFGSERIETEHLLLGLLRDEDCSASRVLRSFNFDYSVVRLKTKGADANAA